MFQDQLDLTIAQRASLKVGESFHCKLFHRGNLTCLSWRFENQIYNNDMNNNNKNKINSGPPHAVTIDLHKVDDFLWQFGLAESGHVFNDRFSLKTHRHSSVQGVGSQVVLLQKLWSSHRLGGGSRGGVGGFEVVWSRV